MFYTCNDMYTHIHIHAYSPYYHIQIHAEYFEFLLVYKKKIMI